MAATVLMKTVRDRWRAMMIGAATLGLLLLFGMAVYREIDLTIYTDLPDALLALMNIPTGAEGADAAGLAYGAIYGSYGALALAGLALSMGSAAITGEERNGTIGLLLANPRSRTHLLVSKAGAMVGLTGLAAIVLLAAGRIVPAVLDVDVTGMKVEALVVHMFVNALFYGFLASAIGGSTGNGGLASGATAALMVLSFFVAGLLPLVEGLQDLAKAFPWYYFDGSRPVNNGINWSHLGVLVSGCVVFGAAAVVGVNRRDMKGPTAGITMLDRLRSYPLTQRLAERLAGSTRVSRIWVKTASEHQGLLFVTAAIMFLLMGVMIGPMYNAIDENILDLADQLPETLLAVIGGGDMSTPEGFYQVETFSLMAPIAVMVVTVAIGARALAGEESRRTIGLLLANPIPRSKVVLEKAMAMIALAAVVGFATFAGTAIGSLLAGLGMNMANIAAASLLVTLLGLVFGALALVLSAGTGRAPVAVYGTIGLALGFYALNAFLPLSDTMAGYAKWSPFFYYLDSEPLTNGMNWADGGLLTGMVVTLIALSVALFDRRDLRQNG